MTNRWFQGVHPVLGVYGVWLSKPGVNVLTATVGSDFLLSPVLKNNQVVLAGSVFCPVNSGSAAVLFPSDLGKKPYIMAYSHKDPNVIKYPYDINDAVTNTVVYGNPSKFFLSILNDRFSVNNLTEYSQWITYMVFLRGRASG